MTTCIIPYIGKTTLAKIVGGLQSPSALWIAYGTGATAHTLQSTCLNAEVARAAATVTNLSTTKIQASHTFTAPYDLTVAEQALLDANGNLLFAENTGGVGAVEEDEEFTLNLEFGVTSFSVSRFVTAGKTETRDLISNQSATAFTYIGYGTGTTAESSASTSLVTQIERVAATIQLVSLYGPLDTLRYIGIFTQLTTARVVSEIGIFNAATSGDMLCRALLDNTVSLAVGDIPVVIHDVILHYVTSTV